jgi:hypothetical protein
MSREKLFQGFEILSEKNVIYSCDRQQKTSQTLFQCEKMQFFFFPYHRIAMKGEKQQNFITFPFTLERNFIDQLFAVSDTT